MDMTGKIEIHVSGLNGGIELNPDNYDIREVIIMLENAENLLYPNNRQGRPMISYEMLPGSVSHVFTTPIQHIIAFNAIIGQISRTESIDFLDGKTALAIENMQKVSQKKGYAFEISTSLSETNKIRLDAKTTYFRKENAWVDAEFYFYGKITDAGGKDKANIHLSTEDHGMIRIQTPVEFLEKYERNILYRNMGIYASGKQHLYTDEIDMSSLKFVDLIDYSPKYDEDYLNGLRERAQKSWLASIDVDKWINQIRGRV
jgi:hypothetical protein